MNSFLKTTRIDAPRAKVWQQLTELDQISQWALGVDTSHYSSDKREGVGAGRTCQAPAAGTLSEEVDQWENEESLGYVIKGVDMLNYWRNSWHMQEAGAETIVTLTTEYEVRFGFVGTLLEKTYVKSMLNKELTSLLASFKYYVETGETVTDDTPLPLAAVS